jgi:5-deoxy-glucuronate isomerase
MISNLLVKAARTGRCIARVTPQSAGWRYVGFEALWLAPGESHTGTTGGCELCIVVVAGRVTVESGDAAWRGLETGRVRSRTWRLTPRISRPGAT